MRRSEARRGESASPAPAAWKREEEARGGRGYPGRILGRFIMLVRMYRVHEWLDALKSGWVADLGGHASWDRLLPTSPKSVRISLSAERMGGWDGMGRTSQCCR